MLRGPLLYAPFEVLREVVELLQPPPRIILPPSPAQRRLGQAHQGRRVERPLEESHVPEQLEAARGRRFALEPTTPPRQQHERKVGPFLLRLDPGGEPVKRSAG